MINVYFNEIGASNQLIGWVFLIQGLCELPFFFYGKRLVDRFGARNVLLFTMIATGLRMFAYGLSSSPVLSLMISTIQGVSMGLLFVSLTSYVHRLVPKQLRSTGQSLIYTFYSVGVAFGYVFAGLLTDRLSMSMVMSIFSIVILLLSVMIWFLIKKSS
jgi:PPP family 3-phenylpropionic acid transporter